MSLGKIWTNTLLLAPFRDPFVAVLFRGTTLAIVRSAPRLSMICPLQGHYHRSKIEPCDQSVGQNRKVSPEPNDIFGFIIGNFGGMEEVRTLFCVLRWRWLPVEIVRYKIGCLWSRQRCSKEWLRVAGN